MKLTKSKLKEIIREELLNEAKNSSELKYLRKIAGNDAAILNVMFEYGDKKLVRQIVDVVENGMDTKYGTNFGRN